MLVGRLPQNPTVWQYLGSPPATVPSDVYTRDYVSIGAACGIAAAFRAPIAGTLFIVEEAASHFKKEEMAQIFFWWSGCPRSDPVDGRFWFCIGIQSRDR